MQHISGHAGLSHDKRGGGGPQGTAKDMSNRPQSVNIQSHEKIFHLPQGGKNNDKVKTDAL